MKTLRNVPQTVKGRAFNFYAGPGKAGLGHSTRLYASMLQEKIPRVIKIMIACGIFFYTKLAFCAKTYPGVRFGCLKRPHELIQKENFQAHVAYAAKNTKLPDLLK